MNARLLWSVAVVFLVGACAGPKVAFEVRVVNGTGQPISTALVKQAPGGARPGIEDGWASPEDIAIGAPQLMDRHWGELIQPGEARVFGPLEGHFPEGIMAVLRVYVGDHTVQELVGYSKKDPDRMDVVLPAGKSGYIINDTKGKLSAERMEGKGR